LKALSGNGSILIQQALNKGKNPHSADDLYLKEFPSKFLE